MKNILDRFLNNNYKYEIMGAVLEKETKTLVFGIKLNFVVPYIELAGLREQIAEKIDGINKVIFNFTYETMEDSQEEVLNSYMDYMIGESEEEGNPLAKAMKAKNFSIKDQILEIKVLGDTISKELNKSLGTKLSQKLKEAFDYDLQVLFVNDEEHYEKVKHHVENHVEEIMHVKKSRTEKKSNPKLADGRILGKKIRDEAVPIDSVGDGSGTVVLVGEIFKIDEKTIRNNKKLIIFLFSDGTSSICAKFFSSEEKWMQIKEHMKKGETVKVRGTIEWDSFAGSRVLMSKDIQKHEKEVREDNAAKKRVELHAHTKMSAMDGLNDVDAMVKQAIDWGHKAIAITDHGVAQSFPLAAGAAKDKIKILYGVEGYFFDDKDCRLSDGSIDYKKKATNHIILLAKNKEGLKNLYKIISTSHLDYFYKRPRIPKSVLDSNREGIIIGSACEAGQVFQAVTKGITGKDLDDIINYYDYLEIQPLINNQFMIHKGLVESKEDLKELNKRIVNLGEEYDKPVVATCDSHYKDKEDSIYREILMAGQGYSDEGTGGLYFRTTEEMLEEFQYLGEDKAFEIVVTNTQKIADMIEPLNPVPKGKFPPKIKDSDKILRDTCEKTAKAKYGDPLPEKIRARLDKELDSIIGNGYAVMYVSAKMLVEKSMEDGFLVGSRGSVGSSFAATMSGVTEVNPLAPHYICSKCQYLEWGDENLYDCGVDMEEKECPNCGQKLDQDGFSIPFETFLGFEGNKEPDIDLNFAGEYQATAHKYVDEIFGAKNVYKAGTISTIASKTAYGFVMKYFESKGIPVNKHEVERLTDRCTGVRRTTGQHPGGIIIVPDDHEIYEFCPVQHPANDSSTNIVTTHFDYHSIDQNLLKLDILGHDVPSMIKHLEDMTGIDPRKLPFKEEKVIGLFNGIDGLGIKRADYRFTHGSFGIPEFGTRFVRQMLDETNPDKFADLVRISGFSHGTNVWINNAQEFIKSGEATMREAISTRDDIMNYLILKGLPNKDAFSIMESVRKGFGVDVEQEELMHSNDVPNWYIESCKRISYMFPRAHAVAYVMMSYRIAYYKVYRPLEFYAVYLTTKISAFNWKVISKGIDEITKKLDSIEVKGSNATAKEKEETIVLEICYEMMCRGYDFSYPSLEVSKAMKFLVEDGKIVVPLCALEGVGENVGKMIESEHRKKNFETIEEIKTRAKANKTAIESLRECGVLEGLSETDQLSLFDGI